MSAPHPASDTIPSPSVARAEERLRVLARLTAKGMEVVEEVKADGSTESVDRFAKVSRSIRLTVMLEEKLDNALAARLAGEVVKAEIVRSRGPVGIGVSPDWDPHAALRVGKKARARQLIKDVVDRESPDPVEHDDLIDALDERLLLDRAYEFIEDLPLRDIVERLCADLQLKPDWKRWTGEGWEPNPPFFRPICSPFFAPGRRPILEDSPGSVPDPWD